VDGLTLDTLRIKTIIIAGVLFVYLYSIVLNNIPIGLDKIITVLSIFLVFPFHIKKFKKFILENIILIKYLILLILLIGIVGFSLVINMSNDISLLYSLILRVTVFYIPILLILFYLSIKYRHGDFAELVLKFLLVIISLQSVFIIWSFFDIKFKMFVDSLLPYIGNIDEDNLIRMRGFSNSSGASLSIVQGIGTYITFYFLSKIKSQYLRALLVSILILNFSSLVFTGRTGMLLFFISFFLYTLITFNNIKQTVNIFLNILYSIIIIYLIVVFLRQFFPHSYLFLETRILPWAFELFVGNEHGISTQSTDALANMIHFPNSFKTLIIGDGIYERWYTLSDSGYVRYMYAMGLIGTITLIASLLYLVIYIKKYYFIDSKSYIWLLSLMISVILVDIKEPFLIKPQVYPLFTIILFSFVINYNYCKYKGSK